MLGGGKKRKEDADISPASGAATAVEAPILAGHPPEVPSLRKKQKISQLVTVNERNNANVGDPNAALILSNGKSGNLAGRECEDFFLTS